MSRGIERRRIARDDRDSQKRLEWLERTVETYGWRLHAFALMPNQELCEASHNTCYVKFGIM